jgi:hypothetical protein
MCNSKLKFERNQLSSYFQEKMFLFCNPYFTLDVIGEPTGIFPIYPSLRATGGDGTHDLWVMKYDLY